MASDSVAKKLLDALKAVSDQVDSSICAQVAEHRKEARKRGCTVRQAYQLETLLVRLMLRWPKSVATSYPVPAPKEVKRPLSADRHAAEISAAILAFQQLPRWKGEYGANRRELLAWMIEQLESGHEA